MRRREFITGLEDKNGKEIYEGDVVRHVKTPNGRNIESGEGNNMYEIVWSGTGLTIKGTTSISPVTFLLDATWGPLCEVIDNIYENPELLS
jgi:uncharacterized phage protein (TIGR01671 family)